MRIFAYILFFLFVLASCQKFTWNNPYDSATPKSVFTPDGLAVRQEGENLLLSWSQDNTNISGFKLFRSIDKGVSSEIATLNKSTLSYTDANVQGGRTYTYTLKAYADKNESNEVSTEIIAKSRPIVNTIAASLITENTATAGGTIVSDGGSPITSKGLVWSTSVNPTIDLTTKTNDGTGSGAFERLITNLSPNTIYYVRAYATNSVGTAYGNQITFTTSKPPAPPILESLTQGLVAYYPFNGNANDESGNGNNGILNGPTLTNDRYNNLNSAYSFNNNHIQIPTEFGFTSVSGDISASLWFNSSFNINPQQYFLDTRFGNSLRITLSKFNTIDFQLESVFGGGILRGPSTTNYLNKWVNMIGILKEGSLYLYLNGSLVGNSKLTTPLPVPLIATPGTCGICVNNEIFRSIGGTNNLYPNQFTIGFLDDIRIYNRALTQEEIIYLANN